LRRANNYKFGNRSRTSGLRHPISRFILRPTLFPCFLQTANHPDPVPEINIVRADTGNALSGTPGVSKQSLLSVIQYLGSLAIPSYNRRSRRALSRSWNNFACVLPSSFLFICCLFFEVLKGIKECLGNLSYVDHGAGRICRPSCRKSCGRMTRMYRKSRSTDRYLSGGDNGETKFANQRCFTTLTLYNMKKLFPPR